MQLYFIRHGQSANNRLWDTTSSDEGRVEDPELTDAGQQQAKLVAQFWPNTRPTRRPQMVLVVSTIFS
jgi:broad specificity phosphatase PhoE